MTDTRSMVYTIIHVYKPGSFGFADFIRSMYSIHDIAKTNGYSYRIAMNHPIGVFFEVDTTPYDTTAYSYTQLLDEIVKKTPTIVLESNHTSFMTPTPKNLLQEYIRPLPVFMESVRNTLDVLRLKKSKFLILHTRYGDTDVDIQDSFIKRIKSSLAIIKVQNMPILLLSSSPGILVRFAHYPGMIQTGYTPCHTSDIHQTSTAFKHTLIEFYIMGFAKKIYSISGGSFGTGKSGFSYWASKMFDIPFTHFA